MATTVIVVFLGDAAHWTQHAPDYVTLQNNVRAAAAEAMTVVCAKVLGQATHSPLAIAFIVESDVDYIQPGQPLSYAISYRLDAPSFSVQLQGRGPRRALFGHRCPRGPAQETYQCGLSNILHYAKS